MEMAHGNGRHRVWVQEGRLDVGRLLFVGGGTSHLGSVVLCQPRKSRTGRGTSFTSQVLNAAGHKDEVIARLFAEETCLATCEPVACIAGIHLDRASEGDIKTLCLNATALLEKYLCSLRRKRKKS
jgi:hypothetical protein